MLLNIHITEAIARRCSVKKAFLEISQIFTGKHLCQSLFFITLQAEACNFIKKETLAQVFSCEFCEISKKTFFHRTPPVAEYLGNLNLKKSKKLQQGDGICQLISASK